MPDFTPPTTPETTAAPADGPSNLRLRIIYGLIGAAMLLSCVWFSPWSFGLFFAGVQAVMLREFYRIMRAGGYKPAAWIGIGAGFALFISIFLTYQIATHQNKVFPWVDKYAINGAACFLLLFPTILLLREIILWSGNGEKSTPFASIGVGILGILYVSLPMSLLNVIAFPKAINYGFIVSGYDYRRVVALLFLIWASDIGAYIAGKSFGKRKMAPSISPGKTWEGWAGGFLLTLVIGWAMGYFLPDVPLAHRLVAAGVVAVFAPLGDLAESMLKRSVGVKDSGTFLPGHGGLLDRFDAFLLVLPVLALLQLLAG